MNKLSGLVLDYYDDLDGVVLKSIFPSAGSTPDLIKSAHVLTPDERCRMPDDTFALVFTDSGATFKKYSMADSGNTALSIEYFLKTGHRLPIDAQQVAAGNLVNACGWFSIDPPEALVKIALGLGSLIGGALVVPGAMREASNNLKAVQGAGGGILTPDQIKTRRLEMGV